MLMTMMTNLQDVLWLFPPLLFVPLNSPLLYWTEMTWGNSKLLGRRQCVTSEVRTFQTFCLSSYFFWIPCSKEWLPCWRKLKQYPEVLVVTPIASAHNHRMNTPLVKLLSDSIPAHMAVTSEDISGPVPLCQISCCQISNLKKPWEILNIYLLLFGTG